MKPTLVCGLAVLVVLPSLPLGSQQPASPAVAADLIVHNARIWAVNSKQPEAQALAVWRDRILSVGSDSEVLKLAGAKTRRIDAGGRRIVPGFHDSHVHLLSGGLQLSQVELKDAADEAEFGKRLAAFDKKLPRDAWLLGGNWDHDRTFQGKLPTAEIIDRYVAERPVFLRRYDGHMAVVNSQALKLAGITAQTPDPSGGVIYRKAASKEPTGLLRDRAMGLVAGLAPPPGDAQIVQAIDAALAEARRVGVTSVEDLDGSGRETRRRLLRLFQELARQGKLTLRIRFYVPLDAHAGLAEIGVLVGLGDVWIQIGCLKDFIDGSLGSSTAKMFEPYEHEPASTGIYVTPPGMLLQNIQAADRAGLQVAVHGIGDRGNAELLDIFAEVAKKNGPRGRRFRIEHAQHLRAQDYRKFAEQSVIASMQPYHIIDDGRWAEGRIGKQRCATSYACRGLLDAGAKLAFGSDWPVAPLSPLLGIDAAVNRRTLDGKNPAGWFPEQKITVAEAIEAYTLGSAYAAFQEKDRGSLEAGKLADLVVLSRDILANDQRDHIADTEVLLTMVGGQVVYDKKDWRK